MQVTAITDGKGAVTRREYNAMGKPCKSIDPLGRETTLTYDQMQNITQVTLKPGARQMPTLVMYWLVLLLLHLRILAVQQQH